VHEFWPTLIDAIIDTYFTPEGIAMILANPEALKNLKRPRDFNSTFRKPINIWNVKYAFFAGRRSFVVDRDEIKLRFHFTGSGWQLCYVELGLTEEKC
jgi:hypothetical protein